MTPTVMVAAFENMTRGDRFEAFNPETSQLRYVGSFPVERRAKGLGALPMGELSDAFEVGNRMAEAWDGWSWPSDRRSMSVGDVVVIDGIAYACESIGWREL